MSVRQGIYDMRFRAATYGYAALLALAVPAFWPRYLSRLGTPIDPYTHWHAALALCWCLLLIAQPLLIPKHRQAHRRLGAFSYAFAPGLAVASLLLASARFRAMDAATFKQEAPSLFLPLSAVFLFSVFYALAMVHRRNLALHARFMILTGLPMIDPVLGRVLFYFAPPLPHPLAYQAITFGLTDLVAVWLAFRPAVSSANRASYVRAAVLLPAIHLAWFTLAQSPAWVPFATWFRSLGLT